MTPCPASHRQRKIRRHKRPCAYYSNPTATFHALLVGDLVFKLNPGPTVNCVPAVVSTRSDHQQIAQLSRPSRNLGNLININCSIDWMDINTQWHYANSILVWSKTRTLISWTMFAIVKLIFLLLLRLSWAPMMRLYGWNCALTVQVYRPPPLWTSWWWNRTSLSEFLGH